MHGGDIQTFGFYSAFAKFPRQRHCSHHELLRQRKSLWTFLRKGQGAPISKTMDVVQLGLGKFFLALVVQNSCSKLASKVCPSGAIPKGKIRCSVKQFHTASNFFLCVILQGGID